MTPPVRKVPKWESRRRKRYWTSLKLVFPDMHPKEPDLTFHEIATDLIENGFIEPRETFYNNPNKGWFQPVRWKFTDFARITHYRLHGCPRPWGELSRAQQRRFALRVIRYCFEANEHSVTPRKEILPKYNERSVGVVISSLKNEIKASKRVIAELNERIPKMRHRSQRQTDVTRLVRMQNWQSILSRVYESVLNGGLRWNDSTQSLA